MRILYVEDNPANLSLLQRIARMGGHEVVTYTEGESALQNFDKDRPDLVLMDVQLAGGLSGLDVVRQIRARGHKLPIVAVTAYAMTGDRERCIEAGCDTYIAKPLPVAQLVELVQMYETQLKGAAVPTIKPLSTAVPAAAPSPVSTAATPPEAAPAQVSPFVGVNGGTEQNAASAPVPPAATPATAVPPATAASPAAGTMPVTSTGTPAPEPTPVPAPVPSTAEPKADSTATSPITAPAASTAPAPKPESGVSAPSTPVDASTQVNAPLNAAETVVSITSRDEFAKDVPAPTPAGQTPPPVPPAAPATAQQTPPAPQVSPKPSGSA
ncbi:MAG: response regulator [bacterium]|nr:response regulator [bacterium]